MQRRMTGDGTARALDPEAAADAWRGDRGEILEALAEATHEGLVVVSAGGRVLYANSEAARLLGRARDELLAPTTGMAILRELAEPSFLARALTGAETRNRTCALPDGRRLLVSARRVQVKGGRCIGLVLRDVTATEQAVARAARRGPAGAWTDLRRPEAEDLEGVQLVATSSAMRAVWERALQYAAVDSPVLLLGETGTGKSLLARLIHLASARRDGPFHDVNCGAIPEALIESELFGYARGAFTGADPRGKLGLVDLAHAGTLVLDEIGELPLGLRVKLLRFLESGETWPVGAARPRTSNVRVIAATNRDLADMARQGAFRPDLYYRLNVLVLRVPALRERPEDIAPLVAVMLERLERRVGQRKRFTAEALARLAAYPFPGNVRELWNLVERLVVTTNSETIDVGHLLEEIRGATPRSARIGLEEGETLKQALQRIEAQILREALERYGTQSRAAARLGIAQATVARKSRQYGLRPAR